MPKSQPANSDEVPLEAWIFWAAVSQVSAARSSAEIAASPLGRVPSHTTSRPAWAR